MNDLITALQIFIKYANPDYPTHCEHDTLYVCISPSLVSDDDKQELERLGFSADVDDDNFYSFKYGSC